VFGCVGTSSSPMLLSVVAIESTDAMVMERVYSFEERQTRDEDAPASMFGPKRIGNLGTRVLICVYDLVKLREATG
jgi:hypothetical protein